VLNSHNKLQIMPIKNSIFLWKRKTTAFWQKKRHFGKITAFTAFDDNHGFRDFRVSVIIYCPYSYRYVQFQLMFELYGHRMYIHSPWSYLKIDTRHSGGGTIVKISSTINIVRKYRDTPVSMYRDSGFETIKIITRLRRG